jgi:hypothetical protein
MHDEDQQLRILRKLWYHVEKAKEALVGILRGRLRDFSVEGEERRRCIE